MLYQLSYVRVESQDSACHSEAGTGKAPHWADPGFARAQSKQALYPERLKKGAHGGNLVSPMPTQLGKLMLYLLSYVRVGSFPG
jgi:hypothetical protein